MPTLRAPTESLWKACYARILADLPAYAGKILARVAKDTAYPYLVLGETEIEGLESGNSGATVATVTVDVYSQTQSRLEAATALATAVEALTRSPRLDLSADNFSASSGRVVFSRVFSEPDFETWHGTAEIEFLIDDTSD